VEVFVLSKNRNLALVALIAGLSIVLFVSCGDDGITSAPCENCGFWSLAFTGFGRYPSVSPVDPELVAFCSQRDTSSAGNGDYYHIWVAVRRSPPDTTEFLQITMDASDDFKPAWSSDGTKIAFERNVGTGDDRQVFLVDVTDPADAGDPVQVTTGQDVPRYNTDPTWVTLGGEEYIAFCNWSAGRLDSDIGMIRYPGLGEVLWVSVDPSDFAAGDNGVMSFTFGDQHVSSNGSNLVTFSSPDRERVADIRVLAKSEEAPTVAAKIIINDKDSGRLTPYTFKYRPAGFTVKIAGELEGYCTNPVGTTVPIPDTTNTYTIDFVHTHGTLAVGTNPGGRFVFIDDVQQQETTPAADTTTFAYFDCISVGEHSVRTRDVYGTDCGDTTLSVSAGEITYVDFDCFAGAISVMTGAACGLGSSGGAPGPEVGVALADQRSIWLIDLGEETGIDDDKVYLVDRAGVGLFRPALSPDGKYVAYVRGIEAAWEVGIADVSGLLSGTDLVTLRSVGLRGSDEDVECWRQIESLSWFPLSEGRKIAAALSPCRGGSVDEYQVWIADLSAFID
jgi:hypothetical protein